MASASKPGKATRTRYSSQFKSEAIALAERVGVSEAAKQLEVHSSRLYNWRSKARLQQDRGEAEQQLATENARLKRQPVEQAGDCARSCQSLLARYGLSCSMSAKGNCYDYACAESFFHTLKVERIHGERFATPERMQQAVFEYIEVDCNRTRRHSADGYTSPMAFEAKRVA